MARDLDAQQKPAPVEEVDEIPRQSLLRLIPRRSLGKAVALLGLLVLIVFLQRRADLVLRHLGQMAPATVPAPAPGAGSPAATEKGARLRLASPPTSGHSSSPSMSPFAPSPSATPPSSPPPRNK